MTEENILSQSELLGLACFFFATLRRLPARSRWFRVDERRFGRDLFLGFIIFQARYFLLDITTTSSVMPFPRGIENGSQSAAAHAELNGLRHRRGHTTHAGLAMMAVTARLGPARNLKSKCAPFLIPDTDGFLHLGQEDFPVADASR